MRVTNVEDYRCQANVERPLHRGVRNNAGTDDGRLLAESGSTLSAVEGILETPNIAGSAELVSGVSVRPHLAPATRRRHRRRRFRGRTEP